MNKLIYILIGLSLILSKYSFGQSEEKIYLNKGIEAYKSGDFKNALDFFNESYAKNQDYTKALFDAADAAFLLDSTKIAKDLLAEYIAASKDKVQKGKGYYNLGNIAFKEYETLSQNPEKSQDAVKHLKESIDYYKKAIRNNPADKDARYNLSLAMSKLPPPNENDKQCNNPNQNKDQQNQGDNKDQGKNGDQDKKDGKQGDNKDQQGDKGDQKKDGENGDKKDDKGEEKGDQKEDENGDKKDGKGGQGDEEKKDQKEKPGQGQQGQQGDKKGEDEMKGKISRMQAQKDLDAMNNDEQKVLMKVNRKKGKDKSEVKSSKDW